MKEFSENKISIHHITKWIIETMSKKHQEQFSLVQVHTENLHINGELSVPFNIEEWKRYICNVPDKNVKNIVNYYFGYDTNSLKELESLYNPNFVIDRIVADSENSLNPRIRIFLNRQRVAFDIIRFTLDGATRYGFQNSNDKNCNIEIYYCEQTSDLTNKRLSLLQDIVKNVLLSQGYKLCCNKECNYILTTRLKGTSDRNSKQYVCGVVLNSSTGSKEKTLTWEIYFQRKVDRIQELNIQRPAMNMSKGLDEDDINKIAMAASTFELVSGRPGSAVQLKTMENEESIIKEAVFVLYNNARITAILDKYAQEVRNGTYSQIKPIEHQTLNFNLNYSEEEWALIYNYILKYPEMLQASVQVEPTLNIRTQSIFSFLSNLCHDFSRYYRKNKILMAASDLSRMEAKLYLLQALRIVLQNTLTIVGIDEINHM